MSSEDYDDVPGLGGMFTGNWNTGPGAKPSTYQCYRCRYPITFTNKKPFNEDGTPHRCIANSHKSPKQPIPPAPHEATLYALAAMNAIINGQIQAGGVDFIHHMHFGDVADAAWRMAAEMARAERQHRDEFIGLEGRATA